MSYSKDCISFKVCDKRNIHTDSKLEEFTHFLSVIVNEEHGRISKIIERNDFILNAANEQLKLPRTSPSSCRTVS